MHKEVNVGDVFHTKKDGEVEVVGINHHIVSVRFLTTGNVREVSKYHLLRGAVRDWEHARLTKISKGSAVSEKKANLVKVGDVFKTNHWGDIEVLERKGNRAIIKFLLSGNTKDVKPNEAKKGNVEDTESRLAGNKRIEFESPQRTAAMMYAGDKYESNYWGQVEVVEYRSSTDVDIRFIESGNIINTQRGNILTGLVRDAERQAKETAVRDADKKAESVCRAKARLIFVLHIRELKALCKNIKSWKQQVEADRARDELEYPIKQEVYHHEEFGEYKIVDRVKGSKWNILFVESGNISAYNLETIRSGNVTDLSRYTAEELATRTKNKSIEGYEKNRDHRIQQAKNYQKANPDKARTFNRRRRARRVGAEGNHTHEEVANLLIKQNNKCVACSISLDEGKHLDHIMPLALGGSNYIENLQWLCPFCNVTKSAKHPDVWAEEILTQDFKDRRNNRLQ